MLRRIKQRVPQLFLSVVYQTTIQPHIDYCITAWGYSLDIYINKIQVLQNRAARIICDNSDWNVSASAFKLVKTQGWFSVKERRDYFMGVLVYRCLTNNAPAHLCDHFNAVSDVHVCGTRSYVHGNLYVPNVKREAFKQSLLYMGPIIWNNLPSLLKKVQ